MRLLTKGLTAGIQALLTNGLLGKRKVRPLTRVVDFAVLEVVKPTVAVLERQQAAATVSTVQTAQVSVTAKAFVASVLSKTPAMSVVNFPSKAFKGNTILIDVSIAIESAEEIAPPKVFYVAKSNASLECINASTENSGIALTLSESEIIASKNLYKFSHRIRIDPSQTNSLKSDTFNQFVTWEWGNLPQDRFTVAGKSLVLQTALKTCS